MAVALNECSWTVEQPGWYARVYEGYMVIHVCETADVSDAIDALIPPWRQRHWTAEAYAPGINGWEVWVLVYE